MSDLMMFAAAARPARSPRLAWPPVDPRKSTSHAVTCDYLVGRGLRVCSCQGPRRRP